jgi:hypothetical protein
MKKNTDLDLTTSILTCAVGYEGEESAGMATQALLQSLSKYVTTQSLDSGSGKRFNKVIKIVYEAQEQE